MAVAYQNLQRYHIIKESRPFAKITKYILRPKISYTQKMPQNTYHGLKLVTTKIRLKQDITNIISTQRMT